MSKTSRIRNRAEFAKQLDKSKWAAEIVELTPYQYRYSGELDIYPSNKRYHILETGERGSYRSLEKLIDRYDEKVLEIENGLTDDTWISLGGLA